MINRKAAVLFLTLGILSGASLFAQAAKVQVRIEHRAVLSFTHGEKIQIQARVPEETDVMRFFYRAEGVQEFQARNMEKGENSNYIYEFDTAELPGLKFEYYLEADTKGGADYSPLGAPQETYAVVGKSQEPLPEVPASTASPQAEAKRFRLPVNLTGSIQALLKEHHHPGVSQQAAQSAANVRVFTSYTKDDLNLGVDSTLSYARTPLPGAKNFDLSNMMVSASKGSHYLRAGDINITETEFTVSGLARRGFDYTFRNPKLSFHVFDVNSQLLKGFKGIGLPRDNASILGGAIGYKLFKDMILLKAVYLAGKDDPAQGINVGVPSFVKSRKGDVLALVEETDLFQNRLTLGGEVARSNFDDDVNDQRGSRTDFAWKVGGNVSSGRVTAAATYRHIGKDFSSIGFPFFANDRQSLETNLGLNAGRITLNGSYISSSDNVKDDPASPTTSLQSGNANLMWNISSRVALGLGYSRNKQDTSSSPGVFPFPQDSLTNQFSGSVNLNLGQAANLSLQLSNSDLSSRNNPQTANTNFTLNAGGALRAGDWFSLSPTFGYGRVRNKFSHEEMFNYSSLLNGEFAFWPQVLSVSLTSSFLRTESSVQGISQNFSLGTNLNWYLKKLISIGTAVLSLKGNYTKTRMPVFSDSYFTAMVQCDFSF